MGIPTADGTMYMLSVIVERPGEVVLLERMKQTLTRDGIHAEIREHEWTERHGRRKYKYFGWALWRERG